MKPTSDMRKSLIFPKSDNSHLFYFFDAIPTHLVDIDTGEVYIAEQEQIGGKAIVPPPPVI